MTLPPTEALQHPRPGRLRRWLAALLAGAGLGLLTAEIMIQGAGPAMPAPAGPWRQVLLPSDGFYGAAQAARARFMAPAADQYARFEADADSKGQGLDGSCLYEIAAPFPGARHWSLEAAGHGPPPKPLDAGDLPGNLLLANDAPDLAAPLLVGPPGDGRRLITWATPTGAKLVLHLFGPAPGDGAPAALPVITRRDCTGGGRP